MIPSQNFRDANKEAQLEARLAALEKAIGQIPSRTGIPSIQRLSKHVVEPAHGFIAGNVVTRPLSGVTVWELAQPDMIDGVPIGVIEHATTDSFTVVFSGEIDTTDFTDVYEFLGDDGTLVDDDKAPRVLQIFGGNLAYLIPGAAKTDEITGIAFFDTTRPGEVGTVVIGATSISGSGLITGDNLSIGVLEKIENGLPMVQSGWYTCKILSVDEGVGHYALIGFITGNNAFPSFPIRFGETMSVAADLPETISIKDPVSGEYWTNSDNVLGGGGGGTTLQTYPTTSTTSDAAVFPISMIRLGLVDERTFAIGDIIPITQDVGAAVVTAPSLSELRDVIVDGSIDAGAMLAWSTVTNEWEAVLPFPTGGTVNQIATKNGPGLYDWEWADAPSGGGGISSVSIAFVGERGICHDDGSIAPKAGDTFIFDNLPVGSDNTVDETVKGSMIFASGLNAVAGQYPTDLVRYFPANAKANALFVADQSTGEPMWKKEIEIGDTTNHGASLKMWWATGKYYNFDNAGKVTLFDSSTSKVEISAAAGLLYTFASGKTVAISNTGKVTLTEAATTKCEIDMANSSFKLTFGTNTIEIASSDFGADTSKAVKLRKIDDCDGATTGFRYVLCSDFFT